MSDALPLPPRPSLEQYKKLAKDLQEACRSGEPAAVRRWATRCIETLENLGSLVHWPLEGKSEQAADEIERRWHKLKETNSQLDRCQLAGMQFFVAREHGFPSWGKFARHIEELARVHSRVSTFEAAVEAIVNGDAAGLRELLRANPGLTRQRSTREHRSTLLHYVSANGVEDFRQRTPKNIVEITRLLLDAGAEVDATSEAYGGGSTPLGLVATSVHPERAGVQIELLETLLEHGANLNQDSGAGNQHSIVHGCIANGQPAAAKFLAERGAALDFEGAAVVGRLDVLQNYLQKSGAGGPPIDGRLMGSAFRYACGYGSMEAAQLLLDQGADVDVRDDSGQTALHWATWTPQIAAMKMLIAHGASVGAKDERQGATPLDLTLWGWDRARDDEDRERWYAAIAVLARAGARLDRNHWKDRGKERFAVLEKVEADLRMLAALRGEML